MVGYYFFYSRIEIYIINYTLFQLNAHPTLGPKTIVFRPRGSSDIRLSERFTDHQRVGPWATHEILTAFSHPTLGLMTIVFRLRGSSDIRLSERFTDHQRVRPWATQGILTAFSHPTEVY